MSNLKHPTETDASLTFADEYLSHIVNGEKTATVRLDDAEGLTVGDEVLAKTEEGSPFARLTVTRTAEVLAVEALGFIELVGAKYGSDTPSEVITGVNQHYDKLIQPSTTVRVIVFEAVSGGDC